MENSKNSEYKFNLILDEKMFQYDLGNTHPMNSKRIFPAFMLLKELFPEFEIGVDNSIENLSIDKEILLKAHDSEYIDTFNKLSKSGKGKAIKYGLGTSDCPVWQGMSEVTEYLVSTTMNSAVNLLKSDLSYIFQMVAGFHHAHYAKASGFCYYNDIIIAIHKLKSIKSDIKILYLDTDLHHGDGTQFGFYNDPNVLTVSFHESGEYLFPGTGFSNEIGEAEGIGKCINLPFYPYTCDETYQKQAEKVFPIVFESFNPDYIIWQAGVDGHKDDYLGHLLLTTNTYYKLGTIIRKLAENMETPKVLTLGGGGYNPYSVAKSWASAISGLSKFNIPKFSSNEWMFSCINEGIDVKQNLSDEPSTIPEEYRAVVNEGNQIYNQRFIQNLSKYFPF